MFLVTAGEICGYIDDDLTNFIHTIILIIQIAVPLLLIIFGMLDFGKSVIGANEDEIRKGQKVFIRRCVSAVVVFFIFSITQLVMGIVASEDSEIWSCASAIMNGTNKQVRTISISDSNNDVPSKATEESIKECCETAGGKIDTKGKCASWTETDLNGNVVSHNINSNAYNACISSKNKNLGSSDLEYCCSKAGGKVSGSSCNNWYDIDSSGQIIPDSRHTVDLGVYNSCAVDYKLKTEEQVKKECCAQAGGTITTNNECDSLSDEQFDKSLYKSCIGR